MRWASSPRVDDLPVHRAPLRNVRFEHSKSMFTPFGSSTVSATSAVESSVVAWLCAIDGGTAGPVHFDVASECCNGKVLRGRSS